MSDWTKGPHAEAIRVLHDEARKAEARAGEIMVTLKAVETLWGPAGVEHLLAGAPASATWAEELTEKAAALRATVARLKEET